MILLRSSLSAFAGTPFVVESVPAGGDASVVGKICSTEIKLPAKSFLATCADASSHTFTDVKVRTALSADEKRRWALYEAESFGMLGMLAPGVDAGNLFGTEGLPESTGIEGLIGNGLGGGTPILNETVDRGPVDDDSGRVWWRFVGNNLLVTANFPSSGWFAIGLGAPNLRSFVVRPNGYEPIAKECQALPPHPCGEGTPIGSRMTSGGVFTTLEIEIPTSSKSGRGVILVPGDKIKLFAKWGRGAEPDGDLEMGSIYEDITL